MEEISRLDMVFFFSLFLIRIFMFSLMLYLLPDAYPREFNGRWNLEQCFPNPPNVTFPSPSEPHSPDS
jgi:hypothetical protein